MRFAAFWYVALCPKCLDQDFIVCVPVLFLIIGPFKSIFPSALSCSIFMPFGQKYNCYIFLLSFIRESVVLNFSDLKVSVVSKCYTGSPCSLTASLVTEVMTMLKKNFATSPYIYNYCNILYSHDHHSCTSQPGCIFNYCSIPHSCDHLLRVLQLACEKQ